MKPFYVYMLRCANKAFYVGHTDDLDRRLAQHNEGMGGEYTAEHRPVELVWFAEMPTRHEAFLRERQIKGWTRGKKKALIRGDWERIHDFARRQRSQAAWFGDDPMPGREK
jgi:predicted GIY-YIG superfamily endonuclease